MLIHEIEEAAKLYNALANYIQTETKDDYWDFEVLPEEHFSKHLHACLDNPEHKIFVAKEDETIIGFIAGEIVPCHLPISSVKKVGYISGAYVLPEYRGRGIMKRLETLLAAYFKDRGLQFMELHFIAKNFLARKSWEALGYKTFREQARKRI